jgi:carboxyl-terminal processing protease
MEQKNRRPLFQILGWIAGIATLAILGTGSFLFLRGLSAAGDIPSTEFLAPTKAQPTSEYHAEITQAAAAVPNADELAALFSPFWTTRDLLHDNFINQPIDDALLAAGAADALIGVPELYEFEYTPAVIPADAPAVEDLALAAGTPPSALQAFLPFWELWQEYSYAALPEDISSTTLMRQALGGMVAALDDDYTNYFDPDLARQYNTDLSGEYEGIGALVDTSTEYLTIISPFKNSPAETAGLLPGDQVVAIDGDDMTGVDPNVALKRVLGPAGTTVTLTIKRDSSETPFDITIVRQRIVIPNVESDLLEGDIAYISISRFSDRVDLDFREALTDLLAQNPKGLIVDLRGNGGGYLHIVVSITSEFIEEGNILIEEFGDGSQKDYPALKSKGIALDIPLVVLIDGGSASASEIFAGAIRDYDRGILIGETSFGKGLVQLPISLPDDQGLVSITIARWLTPGGFTIQDTGIEPDILIERTDQDRADGLDPQLERAVDYLQNGE